MISTARKFFPLLDLVVITLAVYVLVGTCYLGAASRLSIVPQPKNAESEQVQEAASYAPLSPGAARLVVERDLFSTMAARADSSNPLDVNSLTDTALKLRLLGTVAAGMGDNAYAVIEDTSTKKQDLYRVGDTVQSALLKAILRQMVVLAEGGRETVLRMDEKNKEQDSGGPGGLASSQGQGSEMERRISRNELDSSLRNVNQLMTQVRVRPHFNMGQADGLALNRILPNSIFNKMGLENGDVIQAVGDQKIKSVDDVMTLYKSLKSNENMTLQIQRQGSPTTIRYTME